MQSYFTRRSHKLVQTSAGIAFDHPHFLGPAARPLLALMGKKRLRNPERKMWRANKRRFGADYANDLQELRVGPEMADHLRELHDANSSYARVRNAAKDNRADITRVECEIAALQQQEQQEKAAKQQQEQKRSTETNARQQQEQKRSTDKAAKQQQEVLYGILDPEI